MKLPRSLAALGTTEFRTVLKSEIESLDGEQLPLQLGLTRSSFALADGFSAIILDVRELPEELQVKAGIAYRGIIPGCSCADDPTPMDELSEYCIVQFVIGRQDAAATVQLLEDE